MQHNKQADIDKVARDRLLHKISFPSETGKVQLEPIFISVSRSAEGVGTQHFILQ